MQEKMVLLRNIASSGLVINKLQNNKYMIDVIWQLIKVCFIIVISFVVGYLMGITEKNEHFFISNSEKYLRSELSIKNIRLAKKINGENIKKHLKFLTSIPHLAGTEGDRISGEYVENEWKSQGLDGVQRTSYDVYLDYPDDIRYNNIQIFNSNQTLDKTYEIKEKELDPNEDYTKITKPFLAYSIDGSFNFSEVFFLNYCSESDFQLFFHKTGLSLKNKICLCKYGFVFRGNKVKTAEKYGVKAVLLYDDPYRCAPSNNSNKKSNIYPNGEYMPEYGTQRGTIFVHEGDPLTPCYPSIESAYRVQIPSLPKIAAQVIGYKIAEDIFNLINDSAQLSPRSWHGQMRVRYSFGGKLKRNRRLVLNLFNVKKTSKIHNIGGFIRGTTDPDRYIVVGNHRDSWTYGSMDPSLGTAILLEISRVLNELRTMNKWKPKRSILFQSWSGEEYGLVGSTEWVEEYEKKLSANSVIYINLDVSVYGNYSYEAMASPLLFDLLYDVTKQIDVDSNETVYDRWFKNNPNVKTESPYIDPYLGSGSDHMAFLQRAGVPCIDQKFGRKKTSILSERIGSSYPLYHTSYETFDLIDKFIDPRFHGSKILTEIVAEVARKVSSSNILPFNTNSYADVLENEYIKFKKSYQKRFDSFGISLINLDNGIKNFTKVSKKFMERVKSVDYDNLNLIRQYNEQFRNLERSFLDFNSLKNRGYMHMIFAPSIINKYTSEIFPSLTDIINDQKTKNSQDLIEELKLELSVVIYAIHSACMMLKEPLDFERYL